MSEGGLEATLASLRLGGAATPAVNFEKRVTGGISSVFKLAIEPERVVYRYDVEIIKVANGGSRNGANGNNNGSPPGNSGGGGGSGDDGSPPGNAGGDRPQGADGRGARGGNNGSPPVEKSLTRAASDDGQRTLLRRVCNDVIAQLYSNTQGFGVGANKLAYVYDSRKNLFTNFQMQLEHRTYELQLSELTPFCQRFLRSAYIRVEIVRSEADAHVLDLNDVGPSLCSAVNLQSDRSLRTFLELLTSQHLINTGRYEAVGAGKLFKCGEPPRRDMRDGIVTYEGFAKGVRIIENDERQNPCPALVMDVKTCAFFKSAPFDEIIRETLQSHRAQNDPKFFCHILPQWKGVRAYLNYAPSRTIVIHGFTTERMSEITVDTDSMGVVPLAEYYWNKYNIRIRDTDWPAVKAEGKNGSMYPIQCLHIIEAQRVPIPKMNDAISRELLSANTTRPDVRYHGIMEQLREIGMHEGADFLARFGVRILGRSNDVNIGVRAPPAIAFGDKTARPQNARFDERHYRYYRIPTGPQALKFWVVAHSPVINSNEAFGFASSINETARRKGLQLPRPSVELVDYGTLEAAFNDFWQRNPRPQFVTYIDSRRDKSHELLKLLERRHQIITQQLNIETLNKARAPGGATWTNIVNKMNCKFYGWNYIAKPEPGMERLNLDTGRILVVGISASKPSRASAYELFKMREQQIDDDSYDPTVVGICANYLKDPHMFAGDYFYTPSRGECIDEAMIERRMKWILDKTAPNRAKMPDLVLVIRDGISEGAIPTFVTRELPSFKRGCSLHNAGYRPKFIYVALTKRHFKRFFFRTGANDPPENTEPGSVIDRKVVRADIHEFYLQSHFPLKGTAKIPQYTIPVNEVNFSSDQLQALLNSLCHGHQIVNSAVSIPAPAYQAAMLAKRGSANFGTFRNNFPKKVPFQPNSTRLDHARLTDLLCYGGTELSNTRFTA